MHLVLVAILMVFCLPASADQSAYDRLSLRELLDMDVKTISRKPDSVSSVNMTPLAPISLRTIFWIQADSAT